MIQYYSTKQYFHFDCIVLLYVLYNTLMIVVKMSTSYVISTYHICIIMLSPYSTSQNEWIAVIPIPLTPDNSSKHGCWLWIHDVSCLSYLTRYPTHFIVWCVCIDHRPQQNSKKLFLREKRTEKARCICHTRHSTCSHVDLVVLGVSQHSSLSVLFSVAPPNKCRFGDGKRRVTFHQWLFPYIFCVGVYTKLRNISMRLCTSYLCLSFVKSICNCYPQTLRDVALFKNDDKSRKQAGHSDNTYHLRIQMVQYHISKALLLFKYLLSSTCTSQHSGAYSTWHHTSCTYVYHHPLSSAFNFQNWVDCNIIAP